MTKIKPGTVVLAQYDLIGGQWRLVPTYNRFLALPNLDKSFLALDGLSLQRWCMIRYPGPDVRTIIDIWS